MPTTDKPTILEIDGHHARTRKTDPTTSHEAADSNHDTVKQSQDFVADTLWLHGPLADHELVERCEAEFAAFPNNPRWSASRIRTARAELVDQGRVMFAGYFHLTPSGRRAQVWATVTETAA